MAKKHSKKSHTTSKTAKTVAEKAGQTAEAAVEVIEKAKEMKHEVDVARDKIGTELDKAKKGKNKLQRSLERPLAWILLIGGIIGLISAFVITLDKMKLLENADFQPNCNLNPIISCGSVMKSAQGSAFGFPNPWIGLAAFAVLVTIAMGIFAGARFKRWFWIGLQLGTVFGIGFVHWLFFQSVYRIGALCPYCMAVWVSVITIFWYTLLFNIEQGFIKLPKGEKWQKAGIFIRKHHLDILLVWFLVILFFILKHFWYYYGHYLGAN